jgi:hypothetical protein
MRIALVCKDKPDHLHLRLETRAAHRAWLDASAPRVEQAGPLLDAEGRMCGSLIVLDAGSLAEAEAWAAEDPYARAGLFAEVTILPWNRVIG